ncbi:hypothetical protein [Halomonas stenophila]|uniref:PI3K/PI4K catalytic domain-containing protein n=1 Tax=Halomonas stenophila TaxID=795312 RepID=A0A7W5HMQ3_9GAMM|nr:hypothetical protein [Halomonas stenophila]MBB3232899.1 hypothetical protein [Halomonas stenophila]
MTITVLREHDYRGSAPGAVVADGQSAHTHIALLQVASHLPPLQGYVKFYPNLLPNGAPHRGLVNEIVGHLMSTRLGVKVPDRAGLIVLPARHLASLPKWIAHNDADQPLVGWWSQDMSFPSLKGYFRLDGDTRAWTPKEWALLESARQELVNSDQVHAIIALDDLLANVDRNIGNLLRKVQGQYLLIDNGKCLTGEEWHPTQLVPGQSYDNKVAIFTQPDSAQLPFRHATLKAHDEMVQHLNPALHELMPWLNMAVKPPEASAIETFIRQRAAPGRFAQEMGLVI